MGDEIIEPNLEEEEREEKVIVGAPFFPHQIVPLTIVVCVLAALLLLLAALFPPALHEPADPFSTPRFLLPDWYFIWIYGFLKWTGWIYEIVKFVPPSEIFGIDLLSAKVVGILGPALIFLILLILPFIDRGPTARPTHRPLKASIGVAGVILLLTLSVYGLNEIISVQLGLPRELIYSALGALVAGLPILALVITYGGLLRLRRGYTFQLEQCYQCDECMSVCPIVKIGDISDLNLVHNTYQHVTDDVWSCLTCDQCSAACPQGITYSDYIRSLRKDRECETVAHEDVFTELTEIMSLIPTQSQNPGTKAEYGYYGGCLTHLEAFMGVDIDYGEIERASVKILKHLGLEPAVLNLKCCGHDQLWQGKTEIFERLREQNERLIIDSGIKTLIVSCAECYRTFSKDYDLDVEVLHIAELLPKGRLEFECNGDGPENPNVVYHDSCRLGRHMRIYEEPRAVLRRVRGINLVEMENCWDESLCCGVAAMMNCNDKTMGLTAKRLEQARDAGAKYLLTSCTKCLAHFNCVKRGYSGRYDFEVMDMTVFLARNLKKYTRSKWTKRWASG
ncbi:MAG: heterodisulfide reductase-related iron-sulfur binding cluster [Candidatus Geothermarchaeales archaeon]